MPVFDTKNLSPRTLSIYTALVLAAINTVFSLLLVSKWYYALEVFALTFVISYFVYHYTLQEFIYRKIKLIYKFIYQTKATKREEFFYDKVLPKRSLDQVNEDVQTWAEQKKDEIEMLRANEQFRKEFLMNLAHELRTPIFTVQGYVETLLNGAINDASVNKKFLNNASKGIDRLVQLVDDLNEISQLESGKIEMMKEPFIIQDLITDVFEEFSLRAKEKNISLSFKKGTEGALSVLADKQKIKQVLVNLISNAIKYGSEQGSVTAGCYVMDEKHIYIEISDDGVGIDEEHLPRIFERFYRADRSRSREVGGTGLGLAIVKHIVEAHGQTVTVRSKVGVGSSFGFTLEKAE
jgi:two-component system phosphate regulon sensor histidine kinase PhoR